MVAKFSIVCLIQLLLHHYILNDLCFSTILSIITKFQKTAKDVLWAVALISLIKDT